MIAEFQKEEAWYPAVDGVFPERFKEYRVDHSVFCGLADGLGSLRLTLEETRQQAGQLAVGWDSTRAAWATWRVICDACTPTTAVMSPWHRQYSYRCCGALTAGAVKNLYGQTVPIHRRKRATMEVHAPLPWHMWWCGSTCPTADSRTPTGVLLEDSSEACTTADWPWLHAAPCWQNSSTP